MPFFIGGLVLVGSIAIVNLLLTLAVIRRLRSQAFSPELAPYPGPAAGSAIPSFVADTVTGEQVSSDALAGQPAVVAFLSTTCSACPPSIPHLVGYADSRDLKPSQVICVVSGTHEDAAGIIDALVDAAVVVVEPPNGALAKLFQVSAFPTFVIVDAQGSVERSYAGSTSLLESAR